MDYGESIYQLEVTKVGDCIKPSWKDTKSKTYSRYFPVKGRTVGLSSEQKYVEVEHKWKMKEIAERVKKALSPVNGRPVSSRRRPKQETAASRSVNFLEVPAAECSANFTLPVLKPKEVEEARPKQERVNKKVKVCMSPRREILPISLGDVCPHPEPSIIGPLVGTCGREPSSYAIGGPQNLCDTYGRRIPNTLMGTSDPAVADQGVASVRSKILVEQTSTPVNGLYHTRPPLQGSQSCIRQTDSIQLSRRVHETLLSICEASSDTRWATSGGISWREVIRPSLPRDCMLTRFSCEEAVSKSSTSVVLQRTFLSSIDGLVVQRTFLEMCGQSMPQAFGTFFPKSVLDTCMKIGEGTFGEVFLMTKDGRPQAVKVIPIEGAIKYNECDQLKYRDILLETTVAKKLSDLRKEGKNRCPTFMEIYEIHCVVGRYPARMKKEWNIYHSEGSSENDNPNNFQPDQKFAMLVGEHCGTTLEDFIKEIKPDQALSVMWQLSLALAVAEAEVEFEHRDLHLGNIMVRPTSAEQINYMLNGEICDVPTNGIRVSIIDYSLSRMLVDGEVLYVNLAEDETLFEGEGLQYDVYRSMRLRNENNWKQYCAGTNVQWLSYVCRTLSEGMIKTSTWDDKDRSSLMRLAFLSAQLDVCSSALDFVTMWYLPAMEENMP